MALKPNLTHQKWLNKGYETFAYHGPKGLIIKKMSAELEVSRTSFHYHFVGLENFQEELLNMHYEFAKDYIKELSEKAKFYLPDTHYLMLEYKSMGLLQRQLFLNRQENPIYNYWFNKITDEIAWASDQLFQQYFNIPGSREEIHQLHLLMIEGFQGKFDPSKISLDYICNLCAEVIEPVLKIIKQSSISK